LAECAGIGTNVGTMLPVGIWFILIKAILISIGCTTIARFIIGYEELAIIIKNISSRSKTVKIE